MDTSALAKRMKKYEVVPKNTLMRRTPVIIRVDGRAFHIKRKILIIRTRWVIDTEIPIFKGEGRDYIDRLVCIGGVEN